MVWLVTQMKLTKDTGQIFEYEGESESGQKSMAGILKEQIQDTSQTIELTGLGTAMNPTNDDDFLTMNVGKTTATLYDLGAIGRATGQQSILKIIA